MLFSVLSILLLMGQMSILVHAEAHPFHEQNEHCHAFVAAEQTDNTLVAPDINLPVIQTDALDVCFTPYNLSVIQRVYQARAPPFLS
ncbi:MAG: DUF2607 family protein [gamma proteobacterium symbiont of Bathyaustriella thionipta]|nr:DUF2607 family protein [gamma proteobacterium symbiont of Bathyaustriella thionipta]MCU7951148.1 DUF2607 family protein [gamma proteobacterium symbiont of Bathyaustriella thionipta]MCU7952859.1 DUF2607 family protein [gamma proteobacterium symbiont of Bathyaustriella thionipta]MCU7957671.1 DUF2607 family protein [gamma proteobacterium symbiont of Bathyaustriella thionipta]MCU7968983.1 DUF2607 family protein [gamma proteobacterium symbiont of Bathyaustriella thionipta]